MKKMFKLAGWLVVMGVMFACKKRPDTGLFRFVILSLAYACPGVSKFSGKAAVG